MSTTLDKIDTRPTAAVVLDEWTPDDSDDLVHGSPYAFIFGAIAHNLDPEVRTAAERLVERWHAATAEALAPTPAICDECAHAPHGLTPCPGEPDTGGYCGHISGPTLDFYDECPLDSCGHQHDPERGCSIIVEDDDGERPCHATPTCGVCGGTGIRIVVNTYRGTRTDTCCEGCGGLGLS